MRIRGTKPEFWRSSRVASVSWDARLVLKGLESFVDDNGVGRDDLALIVGDLFQRDLVREHSRTLARVSEAISELCDAGLLWRYEANNTKLIYLSFWEQTQRVDKAQDGRFPRPDGTMNYKDSVIEESFGNIRESSRGLAPVTEEQGNRGTGVKDLSASADENAIILTMPATAPAARYPAVFEKAWIAYERKGAKADSYSQWKRAIQRASPEKILAAIPAYVAATAKDPKFRKDFERWLKGDCWESAVVESRATSNGHSPFQNPIDQSVYDEPLG